MFGTTLKLGLIWFRAMDWTRAGQELRQLADAFARSRERQHVRQRAEKVQLESLNFEQFFLLLQELFQVSCIDFKCYRKIDCNSFLHL